MKRTAYSIAVTAFLLSAGCESIAETPLGVALTSTGIGQRNVVQQDGFRLQMDWCEIGPDRVAECQLTATSLTQDYRAGFAYPILQDQTGAEFRMQRKDGKVGGQTMVAGQPYTILFVSKDKLPTTSTQVRSVVGSWAIWTLNRLKAGEFQVVLSDIPNRPAASMPAMTLPVAEPAPATTAETPPVIEASVSDTYWHGTIVPVVELPDSEIVKLWRRGAYIHFRADGAAGYNWSVPGSYVYDAVNKWEESGETFTLEMSGARYTFTSQPGSTAPLVTFIDQGGAFKMTLTPKAKGQP